jgi:archaetidylinositol phosphate synthase
MIEVTMKGNKDAPAPTAQRVHEGLVHQYEKQILLWLAERTPMWVTPDMLTFLALLSSFVCAVSYFLSSTRPEFLHLANFCIVVHWYGDSLDGALARYRNKQRPNYGLFVDMMCDMFAVAFILVGMGNSIMNLTAALSLLGSFYLLTVVNLFILRFRNNHVVSAGRFSGTEARALLIASNLMFYFKPSYEMFLAVNTLAIIVFIFVIFMAVISAFDLGAELKAKDEAVLAAYLNTPQDEDKIKDVRVRPEEKR